MLSEQTKKSSLSSCFLGQLAIATELLSYANDVYLNGFSNMSRWIFAVNGVMAAS